MPRRKHHASMNSTSFRVIETLYKGYRFRSRTEARWAVFLDTLGLEWTYEKEGFDLEGTWYLPDFWLPRLNAWIEIKGLRPTAAEVDKARKLASATTYKVLIVAGQPWQADYDIMLAWPDRDEVNTDLVFGEINGALCLRYPNDERLELQRPYFVRQVGAEYIKDVRSESSIQRAFLAARGARFERTEQELDKTLKGIGLLLAESFGCEHVPSRFSSVEAFFRELGLTPLCWRMHTFVLTEASHEKVGCIVVRDSDRQWAWFEIDWQHFMRKTPIPSDHSDSGIPADEIQRIVAWTSRKVRQDPLAFMKRLGMDNAICWRNLAVGMHVNGDALELIVLRITDGKWWAVPFDNEMFDQI